MSFNLKFKERALLQHLISDYVCIRWWHIGQRAMLSFIELCAGANFFHAYKEAKR
jgi:hypothetical protein